MKWDLDGVSVGLAINQNNKAVDKKLIYFTDNQLQPHQPQHTIKTSTNDLLNNEIKSKLPWETKISPFIPSNLPVTMITFNPINYNQVFNPLNLILPYD